MNWHTQVIATGRTWVESSTPKPILRFFQALNLETLIFLVIGLFITGILAPPAISAISTASTTSWQAAVVTVFMVLLPVLAVLAVSLYFFSQIRASAQ